MMGLAPLKEETLESLLPLSLSWPRGDMARGWPSAKREEGSCHNPTRLAPSRPPDPWEMYFCCLSHPIYGILLQQTEQTSTHGYKIIHNWFSV